MMHLRCLACLTIFAALCTAQTPAPNPTPRGLAALHVPDGFSVEIAAQSELAPYPMFMTFDEHGRMFIAESSGKNISGKAMVAAPECTILMLEDKDHDGVFDTRTVFADKLSLPMGVLWYQGSLYVASPPDFLRFDDTNGDGVADHREVVLTGWNVLNTASLHGPFLGPDGWLYLTHGRHGYKITTKEGDILEGKASRIWRCHPDGTNLERMCGGGFDNPVELIFTEAGESVGTMTYFTDPKNGQRDSLMHFMEGGVYPKPEECVKEFIQTGDLMPVMTKFARIAPAGLLRYRGDSFGPEFKGNLFSAQFNPHRVQRHIFTRAGATFTTKDSDFLTSPDPDFHPTDVLEDADGSILVSDTGGWYVDACPISRVAKPEVRGTIYRIRKKGAITPEDPWGLKTDFNRASPKKLVTLLNESRPRVSDHAEEQLVKLGKKSDSALRQTLAKSDSEESRVLALWALSRIDTAKAWPAIEAALADSSPTVRIAASRALGLKKDETARQPLKALLADSDLAVRRQAATALGQLKAQDATPYLVAACKDVDDRFLEHALIYAMIQIGSDKPIAEHLADSNPHVRKAALIALDQMKSPLLDQDKLGTFLAEKDPELRKTALWVASHHVDWSGAVLAFLDARLHDATFDADSAQPIEEVMLAYTNNERVQTLVGKMLADEKLDATRALFLLDLIGKSSLTELPAPWLAGIGHALDSQDQKVRWRAVSLLQTRAITKFDDRLLAFARSSSEPMGLRLTALAAVTAHRGAIDSTDFAFLTRTVRDDKDATNRLSAAKVFSKAKLTDDQRIAIARNLVVQADALALPALLQSFTDAKTEPVGSALVSALGKSHANAAALMGARTEVLLAQFPASVQTAAAPLFAQAKADEQARIERLSKLEPLLSTGDVGRGRRVFFSEQAACYTCHSIGSEGGNIGPDLTTIGAIRSGHDLLEAVLFPSASFVPGYEPYRVETDDGTFTGVIATDTPEAITLKTAVNQEARIPRKDIKSMTPDKVSVMPEGIDGNISQQDLLDIMAFLRAQNNEVWLVPEKLGKSEH